MKKVYLNNVIDRFNQLMDYLKANGGEVEKSELSDFEEVSFRILDTIYVMHRSYEQNDRYYCFVTLNLMYGRTDSELHTFNDFDDDFNHANVIESRHYDLNPKANWNKCLDYSEFNDRIDKFKKDIDHFIELRSEGYA